MLPQVRQSGARGFLQFISSATVLIAVFFSVADGQDFTLPSLLKSTQDAEIWFGFVPAQHDGSTSFNTDFWMGGLRFGRILTAPHGPGWLRGTLQWSLNAVPLFLVSNLQNAYGAELDPLVWRWNIAQKGSVAPYFEMAGGVAVTSSRIPSGDTSQFNIVPKIGFGWQKFIHDRNSIDVGVYAWHLSNAWTAPRNPSANGIQLTVGYHWFNTSKQSTAHVSKR